MNKLDELLKTGKKPLLMAHFIAGYPTVNDSRAVADALVAGGADILELQIPFSDPLADGPTIMQASQEAIAKGAKVEHAFALADELTKKTKTPLVIMSYANPLFRYGIPKFVADAKKSGASGLIVPDVPFDSEEGEMLLAEARKNDIHLILVISPGVSSKRLTELAPSVGGFVYCTSRQGITGADSRFAADLSASLEDARNIFKLPLGLGFGVKSAEDFALAAKLADIVIAGSVFVEVVKKNGPAPSAITAAVRALRGT